LVSIRGEHYRDAFLTAISKKNCSSLSAGHWCGARCEGEEHGKRGMRGILDDGFLNFEWGEEEGEEEIAD
jgi:hypothetical protein